MNKNDIELIKESIKEYCEELYGMCIPYMKKHNINYKLTNNDKLSLYLKEVTNIEENIDKENDYDKLINIKSKLLDVNKKIKEIIEA